MQKGSHGRVEIWSDADFVRIEQKWKTSEGHGKRWGAEDILMIFNAKVRKLAVVNRSQNRFTRLGEDQISAACADLSKKATPAIFPSSDLPTPPAGGAISTPSLPTVVDNPQKSHSEGCKVYRRDLPFGLEEEMCVAPLQQAGVAEDALGALWTLGEFIKGLESRIPEFGAVFAISEAGLLNLGLLRSHFKFGVSLDIDQESSGEAEMESWDRIIWLDSVEPWRILPNELNLPDDAEEESGLVPWNTPFLEDNGPSHKSKQLSE